MKFSRLTERNYSSGTIGLLTTAIFHLVVIIIMLGVKINSLSSMASSFVFDFSQQEKNEQIAREEAFKEDVSRHIDELIRAAEEKAASEVRNIAVDASSIHEEEMKELMEEAQRVMDNLHRQDDDFVDISPKDKVKESSYNGPAVVSYTLDGRKASHLKIPAYRCMGGGYVTVTIIVDPHGNVVSAKINDAVSSTDPCLRDFAVKAARLSRFSKSTSAPSRQPGEIVYRFVAQ